MKNPWLNIPAEDYEAHMSAPHVRQTEFLSSVFKIILEQVNPKSILVAGCTTGNGLDQIDFREVDKVTGVDINEEYISIAAKKYTANNKINFLTGDICTINPGDGKYDLMHCALIFEYVDVKNCLRNLTKYLSKTGTLSVLLQLPGKGQKIISATKYKNLELLSSIMKLVDPGEFKSIASESGLTEIKNEIKTLSSGKSFYVGLYRFYKS